MIQGYLAVKNRQYHKRSEKINQLITNNLVTPHHQQDTNTHR